MNLRMALAIIVNLLAVSLPALGLYFVYGLDTKLEATDASQLLALGAAAICAFLLGILGSVLLRAVNKPEWESLIEKMVAEGE